MAFTQNDLAAIDTALATGELTVEVGGIRVTYQSAEDLRIRRDIIRAELQAAGVVSSPPRVSYIARVRD
jgi:hypothetical protein